MTDKVADQETDQAVDAPHILIIEARFYADISDELLAGATAALAEAGARVDRHAVPGALEIPAALSFVLEAAATGVGPSYDGFVLLGCVIRGQTGHYDIVAGQSARAVMDLSVAHGLAVGNGILTVDTVEQARERAGVGRRNKGGAAARAALAMLELKRELGL